MYTYKIGISAKEHDTFVLNHPQANLLQSSDWASIKDNWKQELIGFYRDGEQVASAACLIRPLPLGRTMIYIPRGPIMDYTDRELLQFVIKSLQAFGKSKGAVFVKCDPSLFLQKRSIEQDVDDNEETLSLIAYLKSLGVDWSNRTTKLEQTIQPRLQANIYAKDFDLANLSKKTKQAIRTATNKGVNSCIGSTELLDDFAELMKKTENRKEIHLRGREYYEKLMTTYGNHAYITMARLNIPNRLQELRHQLDKSLAEQSTFTSTTRQSKVTTNQKNIERIQTERAFLEEILSQGKEDVPLAATLTLMFGDTSENLYAGMDETFRPYQASIFTWYHTAKEAFEKGARWHNLGGIENQLDGGLYHFKARLNPTIEEFAGEFNIPVGILSKGAIWMYNLRKEMRNKH